MQSFAIIEIKYVRMKKETTLIPAGAEAFIRNMEVNKMYELQGSPNFKWAMIEHHEHGYCWTLGYKGMCTITYSTDTKNNIKYWTKEDEAKTDLIKKVCSNS